MYVSDKARPSADFSLSLPKNVIKISLFNKARHLIDKTDGKLFVRYVSAQLYMLLSDESVQSIGCQALEYISVDFDR